MPAFIAKRIIEGILVLWVVASVTFFMVRLAPGNPFSAEKDLSPSVLEELEKRYGLDAPMPLQYARFMGIWRGSDGEFGGLLQGELPSLSYRGWNVTELIGDKILVSTELGILALTGALLFGICAGLIASARPNRWNDYLPMSLAMTGICLPTFVLGPLFILLFALQLGWFNASGWHYPTDRVLPALTLTLFYAAYVARLTRGSMLEVRALDYMRTARAKGLKERTIFLKHGLRNGIGPVLSFVGPAAAGLVSGSFVVETIFDVPGLGKFFVEAAFNRDHFLAVGCATFYAALLVLVNLIVDILQVWLNPKQSFE